MTPLLTPKGNGGPLLCKCVTFRKNPPIEILTNIAFNLFFLTCVAPPTKYKLLKDRTEHRNPLKDRNQNKSMNKETRFSKTCFVSFCSIENVSPRLHAFPLLVLRGTFEVFKRSGLTVPWCCLPQILTE